MVHLSMFLFEHLVGILFDCLVLVPQRWVIILCMIRVLMRFSLTKTLCRVEITLGTLLDFDKTLCGEWGKKTHWILHLALLVRLLGTRKRFTHFFMVSEPKTMTLWVTTCLMLLVLEVEADWFG